MRHQSSSVMEHAPGTSAVLLLEEGELGAEAIAKKFSTDGGPDCEATVWIDHQELSLREFGRLRVTHAGWGMRIVFVPDDEIDAMHPIEIREPDDDQPN